MNERDAYKGQTPEQKAQWLAAAEAKRARKRLARLREVSK